MNLREGAQSAIGSTLGFGGNASSASWWSSGAQARGAGDPNATKVSSWLDWTAGKDRPV